VHETSGWCDYLYRWYASELQRWPNRDPIEERGGLNIFLFVENNPITGHDPAGLIGKPLTPCQMAHAQLAAALAALLLKPSDPALTADFMAATKNVAKNCPDKPPTPPPTPVPNPFKVPKPVPQYRCPPGWPPPMRTYPGYPGYPGPGPGWGRPGGFFVNPIGPALVLAIGAGAGAVVFVGTGPIK